MIHCLHCGAETSNGLALCELCRRLAASIFDMLPVYFRNLARQRRPGRPNGSLGSSGSWLIKRGESDGSRVSIALERAINDLDTWARALSDDRGVELPDAETEADTVIATCRVLGENLTSIATLEWAGQFLRDIAKHERVLRSLTESVVPGWYAGTCRRVTGHDMEGNIYHCGTDTFVIPGLTWVTCTGCGARSWARDHLERVREEASDWIAPPMRLAEALVALMDTEQSVPRLHKRISKWGERESIEIIRRLDSDGDPVGPKRYRFGQVMDRLIIEGATRTIDEVKARAS